MEPVKVAKTRSKSISDKNSSPEKSNSSDSEVNGEKAVTENEESTASEVSESPVLIEEKSKVDADETIEKMDEDTVEDEPLKSDLPLKDIEINNVPEKKTRKRKVSEVVREEKHNSDNVLDSPNKDVIEDEHSDKAEDKLEEAKEDDKYTGSDLSLPESQGFGKGKRARIPNKRYSDIALSTPNKIIKPTYLENGEKEKEKVIATPPPPPIEQIESETSGTNSPTPKRLKAIPMDMKNPSFLKPFKFGWRRELVWRSVGDNAGRKSGDIYYYTPEGKKLRSMREIADNLKNKDLSIENFTYFKSPIGLDSTQEIIRHAKVKSAFSTTPAKKLPTPKQKKVSPKITSPKVQSPAASTLTPKVSSPRVHLTKLENSDEGKSIKPTRVNSSTTKGTNTTADSVAEPKTPKASALKVKLASKTKNEKKVPAASKQVTPTVEEEAPMAGKKAAPRRSGKWGQNTTGSSSSTTTTEISTNKPCQPCSIRCLGVQGLVPNLQCRVCLCLYHNECVGLVPNIVIPNYVCKNCQLEQGGQNMSTGIAPPPLTPITALQSVSTQPTVLPTLQRIPKSPESETPPSPDNVSEKLESVPTSTENTSILGHMTSWLPQNSKIQVDSQPRSVDQVTEPSRPQYVEFLGGRKFLIIPKYNVVSVSPTVTAVKSVEPTQSQEAIDLIPAQTADVATTVKTEPVSPSKPENSQTAESVHPRSDLMDVDDNDIKPTVTNIDLSLNDVPITSESTPKTPPVPKKKTLKLNNITNQSNEKSGESKFMDNYLQNLSYGYNTLLYVFQYLKVQDLLRAGCVCTMWRDIASHPLLWRTVRMKNSQVHSFEGLANTLQKHGTVQLDLRKMLLTNCDEIWPEFSNNIGKVETLRKIELCRCPASVVEKLSESNPKLEVVNAVTIRCETMNLEGLSHWTNLRELRLKSTTGLTLESDINSLKSLVNLKSLSLTSIRDLNTMELDVIAELSNLESLDLGECTDFPENFGKTILSRLKKLEKLRLEKGQGHCYTFEILDAVKDMKHLEQLELVNFDIKAGFDKALGACKNIKKLLIIPTYISQSATTNHMVLGGVLRLQKSLSHFVWGVTLELLRVTELFVDQCEEPEKKEKKEKKLIGNGDSIPVLKPVPLITDDESEIPPALDPPQVEILALPGLQKLLLQSLPTTRVKILKIPFHATWRQSITDAVN